MLRVDSTESEKRYFRGTSRCTSCIYDSLYCNILRYYFVIIMNRYIISIFVATILLVNPESDILFSFPKILLNSTKRHDEDTILHCPSGIAGIIAIINHERLIGIPT